MNLSSRYMIFWIAIVTIAFVVDYLGLLQQAELDGKSFFIGLIVGFVIMKFAPNVQTSENEGKEKR